MFEKDRQILFSLWRWKCLTTAAITELCFPQNEATYSYRRLIDLHKNGLVETAKPKDETNSRASVWLLTKKGFKAIRPMFPYELKEEGYSSEVLNHDLLLSAVHLGDWLQGAPQGCSVFTEQQLKRMHAEHFPSWVPKDLGHRPDGYWRTLFKERYGTIALEVERSQKYFDDYVGIAQFYALQPSLFRVIWVVTFDGIARRILSAAEKVGGESVGLHNFIREREFRDKGWASEIFLGRDQGKSLSHFLPSGRSKSEQYIGPTLILNTQKSPHMSKSYRELRKKWISHRVVPSLLASSSIKTQKGNPTNET